MCPNEGDLLEFRVVQVVRFSCFFTVKRYDAVCICTEKSFEKEEKREVETKKVFENSEKSFPCVYFFDRNLVKKREWGLWQRKDRGSFEGEMLRRFFKNILIFSFSLPQQREAEEFRGFCGRFVNRPYKNFCDAWIGTPILQSRGV